MKIGERVEGMRVRSQRNKRAPGEAQARDLAYRIARQAERAERVERLRKQFLSETDQVFAKHVHVPRDFAGKKALAEKLRIAESGRVRTLNQIGALMGISGARVSQLLRGEPKPPRPKAPKVRAVEPPIEPRKAEEFSKRLHQLRRAHGLSQQKLATMLDVHRSTIADWESGEKSPSPSNYARVMKILRGLDI